jgi:hypothetical protein
MIDFQDEFQKRRLLEPLSPQSEFLIITKQQSLNKLGGLRLPGRVFYFHFLRTSLTVNTAH